MHAGSTALRNERLVAFASLLAVAAVAWLWLLNEAARMSAMPAMPGMPGMPNDAMAAPDPWNPTALALTLVMWTVMMVGMMLPSAAPAIVLYGTMVRKGRDKGSLLPPVWLFAAGYLAVWTGFSLLRCAPAIYAPVSRVDWPDAGLGEAVADRGAPDCSRSLPVVSFESLLPPEMSLAAGAPHVPQA